MPPFRPFDSDFYARLQEATSPLMSLNDTLRSSGLLDLQEAAARASAACTLGFSDFELAGRNFDRLAMAGSLGSGFDGIRGLSGMSAVLDPLAQVFADIRALEPAILQSPMIDVFKTLEVSALADVFKDLQHSPLADLFKEAQQATAASLGVLERLSWVGDEFAHLKLDWLPVVEHVQELADLFRGFEVDLDVDDEEAWLCEAAVDDATSNRLDLLRRFTTSVLRLPPGAAVMAAVARALFHGGWRSARKPLSWIKLTAARAVKKREQREGWPSWDLERVFIDDFDDVEGGVAADINVGALDARKRLALLQPCFDEEQWVYLHHSQLRGRRALVRDGFYADSDVNRLRESVRCAKARIPKSLKAD